LPIDIAKIAQPLTKCIVACRDGTRCEDPDPPDLPRRLRLAGERRGEEAERDAGDECPSIHHSMT